MDELSAQDERRQLLKGISKKGTGAGDRGGDERVNLTNRFLISSEDLGFPFICMALLAGFRCDEPTCVYVRAHTRVPWPSPGGCLGK